jgi:hypothetical protein
MEKETIRKLVLNNVLKHLKENKDINYIKTELFNKIHKFIEIISRNEDIDVYELLTYDPDTITPDVTKYRIMYINECNKRINDLSWIVENKKKFPKLDFYKIFKLLLLKERLTLVQ